MAGNQAMFSWWRQRLGWHCDPPCLMHKALNIYKSLFPTKTWHFGDTLSSKVQSCWSPENVRIGRLPVLPAKVQVIYRSSYFRVIYFSGQWVQTFSFDSFSQNAARTFLSEQCIKHLCKNCIIWEEDNKVEGKTKCRITAGAEIKTKTN